MVDRERVDRLLSRLADDIRTLDAHRAAGADLLDDPTGVEVDEAKVVEHLERLGDLDDFVREIAARLSALG